MGYLGFEPRTIRLKAEYSTVELVTLYPDDLSISYIYDSNHRYFSNIYDYILIKLSNILNYPNLPAVESITIGA